MGTGYTRNDTSNNIADGNVINAADLDGEFDAIESAFNSSTGHTHDGTSAEGAPIEVLGPSQDVVITASVMRPKTTNTVDLGTSSLLYKDAFIDGTATIGDIVIDNAGTIGSASDTDAITISSSGIVTFSQAPIVDIESATTNSTINTLILRAQSSGTPAVGIGTGMRFEVETAAGNVEQGAAIRAITTSLTPTDEEIDLVFLSMQNGSLVEAFRYDSTNDQLDVSGSIKIGSAQELKSNGTIKISADSDASGSGTINFKTNDVLRVGIQNNGDTYFYEDTGATIKMDWDATNEYLHFRDDVKASFGSGNDLEIYHNASDSYISDSGTGELKLTSNGTGITFEKADGTEIFDVTTSAATKLYYNGSEKLATTSGGVDIKTANDGSADGPILNLYRNSATPVADDDIGLINFSGENDAASETVYGRIEGYIKNATSTSEDGRINFLINSSGTLQSFMDLNAAVGGADGRVTFNQSNLDIDTVIRGDTDSNLFYADASEDRIGMGTGAPDTLLHLKSTTADQLTLDANSTTIGPNLVFRNTDGILARIASQETNTLRFDVGPSNTEAMRIDDGGRLLIGPVSANTLGGVNANLQVAGTGGTTSALSLARYQDSTSGSILILHKSRGATLGSQGLAVDDDQVGRIDFSSSDGVDGATVIAGMEARVDMGASGTAAADTLGGRLIWSTNAGTLGANSSDRMALTNAGTLIIGAGTGTDPDANVLLELAQNNGGRNGLAPLNTLRFRDTDTACVTDQPFGRIEWMTADTSSGGANVGAYIEALARDSTPDTELVFATSTGASLSEAMRIDKFGHVGISTTPDHTLHIDDAENSTDLVYFNNAGSTAADVLRLNTAGAGTGTNILDVQSSDTTRFLVRGDGNVAIGHTSPDTMLHLSANNNSLSENNTLRFTDEDTAVAAHQKIGSIEFETLDPTNAVGVSARIDAEHGGTGASGTFVFRTGVAGSLYNRFHIDTSETIVNEEGQDLDFRVETPNYSHMLFVDAGNDRVGIGTGSPSTTLHLFRTTAEPMVRFQRSGATNAASSNLGGFEWYNSDGSNDGPGIQAKILGESYGSSGAGMKLVFFTHDGTEGGEGSDPVERMTVRGDGCLSLSDNGYNVAGSSSEAFARNLSISPTGTTIGVATCARLGIITETTSNTSPGNVYAGIGLGVREAAGGSAWDDDIIARVDCIDYRSGSTSNEDGGIGFYVSNSSSHTYFSGGFSNAGGFRVDNVVSDTGSEDVYVGDDLTVIGALSKGSGSFKIPHPIKPHTHHLVHSFVEGPQADNIYRGRATLVAGTASINIDTEAGMTDGTFVLLNRDVQCFTSNETGWTAVKGSVSGNTLTITAQDNTCTDTISWMVVGERQDDVIYESSLTDTNGKIIVEPMREIDSMKAGA